MFPAMAVVSSFSKRLGSFVREIGRRKACGGWYVPHMAAAERAIRERIPMVDLVVEVRDARIPLASVFEPIRHDIHSDRHMIILNKMDLADCSQTEKWTMHFQKMNHICLAVNSHNNESIKQLLRVVKRRAKDLKVGVTNDTATVLLVGIPNVGKSAIANSLHLIGRIDAAEKGKLKHATVGPQPGETQEISGYKIASHPNVYVFDTPGVLSAEISDDHFGSKLSLTGAIKDSLVDTQSEKPVRSGQKRMRQYASDHTQVPSDWRQITWTKLLNHIYFSQEWTMLWHGLKTMKCHTT